MQVHNHVSPLPYGHGVRPNHSAQASSRSPEFAAANIGATADATTEAPNATTAAEDSTPARIPGKSVAHQARANLATLAGLGGRNFGWLVSQIARSLFDASAYASQDATGGATETADGGATVGETAADATGDASPATDEASAPGEQDATGGDAAEETDAAATLLDELAQSETPDSEPAADDTAVVVDLIDELLNSETDDSATA